MTACCDAGRARHKEGRLINILDESLQKQEERNRFQEELMDEALSRIRSEYPNLSFKQTTVYSRHRQSLGVWETEWERGDGECGGETEREGGERKRGLEDEWLRRKRG